MASSKPQERGKSARTHSYQTGFQSTKLDRAPHRERLSLPAWCGGGITSAKTMLLVFGRGGGDSFRNLDRRQRWPLEKATTYSTQHPPKFHRVRISFQNQDGLNTTHTTTQALSAGCGGNTSTRNTMRLVFNRGGPGSYRRRDRRGVISQKETHFYSKAQQIPRSFNLHSS